MNLEELKKYQDQEIKVCKDKWTNKRLKYLNPIMATLVSTAISECERRFNIQIRVTADGHLRGEKQQNTLYGSSRTASELDKVGVNPAYANPDGRWKTNAYYLLSYHNYGLAVDICLISGNQASFKIPKKIVE